MAEQYTSIKQLVHFMTGGPIRLSRQDSKFLANIQYLLQSKANITTNQVGLFNHLLRKYDRQFSKMGFDVNSLMQLPWGSTIVESSPQYTDANLSLVDGEIIFRCPYNTKFLKDFRELPNSEAFVWNKTKKQYQVVFNTAYLKLIVTSAFKHFNTIHCCPIIIGLLDELVKYDNIKYWNPTLTKVGNHYIIAASNESINNIITDIELSDDPFILNYLSKHAINIDEAITKTPIQLFAATFNPVVDFANSETLVNWLVEIKCDGVYLEHKHFKENNNWTTLKQLIVRAKLPVYETSAWRKTPNPKEKGLINPVLIKGMADTLYAEIQCMSKIITMVNNKPVALK
jgi:hypothetical protein